MGDEETEIKETTISTNHFLSVLLIFVVIIAV